jgi:3-oxoacyl-[acyl-carrier protein] reductase
VVVVTGAAGGLGRGLASEFAAQGWRVVAAGHRGPPRDLESNTVWPVQWDVTDRAQAEATVRAVLDRWGRIDVLIANAGITADALLSRMSETDWDRVLAVNLKGGCVSACTVLPPMLQQRGGHIIYLGSFAGRVGGRGQSNYAAAKAGLIGLAQSLAREVGTRNVRVNVVLPGVLPTPMTAKLGAKAMAGFEGDNVLKRTNTIDEVARFIAFLASTRNVSGQVFQLDSRIGPWT